MAVGGMELASRLPEAEFLAWGWRIPFLFSAVLVAVGLVIRLRIEEPPAFKKVLDTDATVKLPIVEAVRRFPRAILMSAGLRFADNILYYVFTTFGLTYMTSHLGLPRKTVLVAILIAAALELLTNPLFGALSDKFGRKQVVVFGASIAVVAPFPFFHMIGTGNPTMILFAEMFSPEVRYSGVTIGFQLGALVAGAPTPLIATALLAKYGDYTPVAIFAMVAAGITLVCALFARVANDRKAPSTAMLIPASGTHEGGAALRRD
jgi:MFS family permease